MIAVNMFAPAVALVSSPLLARALGPDGRGLYAALTVPLILAGTLGTLGMQDSLTYHVANKLLSVRGALKFALWWIAPASILTVICTGAYGFYLFSSESLVRGTFFILLAAVPFQIALNLLAGIATGSRNFSSIYVIQIASPLLRLGFLVSLLGLVIGKPEIAAAIFFAPSILLVPLVWRRVRREHNPKTEDRASRKEAGRYALAAFPGVLATLSTARLDQLLALPLIGASQLGIYASAVALAELPLVVALAARTLSLSAPGENPAVSQTRLLRNSFFLTSLTCFFLWVAAPTIIPTLFGTDFTGAIEPCRILLTGSLLYAVASTCTGILLRAGRPKTQSTLLILSAGLGVIGLFALAPYGAVGAALASSLSYAAVSIVALACVLALPGFSVRLLTRVFLFR
ncbi:MATE family efflux transporter [Quadrisphaera oryzae]|uniref:oligosaccharide flippase family protein n=1 Tax=Quadrisphaera sp. RL12-1S TaxID=2763011 RepID=UPI0021042EB7|nr:oligosaccharide flippase family protein [Quadrisphaera sp. RL12-1S]